MMWFFVAGVANVAVKFPGRNSVNILLSKDRPRNTGCSKSYKTTLTFQESSGVSPRTTAPSIKIISGSLILTAIFLTP
jgi:hypothetical protein